MDIEKKRQLYLKRIIPSEFIVGCLALFFAYNEGKENLHYFFLGSILGFIPTLLFSIRLAKRWRITPKKAVVMFWRKVTDRLLKNIVLLFLVLFIIILPIFHYLVFKNKLLQISLILSFLGTFGISMAIVAYIIAKYKKGIFQKV